MSQNDKKELGELLNLRSSVKSVIFKLSSWLLSLEDEQNKSIRLRSACVLTKGIEIADDERSTTIQHDEDIDENGEGDDDALKSDKVMFSTQHIASKIPKSHKGTFINKSKGKSVSLFGAVMNNKQK